MGAREVLLRAKRSKQGHKDSNNGNEMVKGLKVAETPLPTLGGF